MVYIGSVFSSLLIERHPLKTRSIVSPNPYIVVVLSKCGHPEITTAIVQFVLVSVIDLKPFWWV